MKIRSLVAAAALAAGAASMFTATPASAWTCPRYTQEYWVDNPVTGGQTRICTPYLSCETCWVDVR